MQVSPWGFGTNFTDRKRQIGAGPSSSLRSGSKRVPNLNRCYYLVFSLCICFSWNKSYSSNLKIWKKSCHIVNSCMLIFVLIIMILLSPRLCVRCTIKQPQIALGTYCKTRNRYHVSLHNCRPSEKLGAAQWISTSAPISSSSKSSATLIDRLPANWRPYFFLARFDKPIGTFFLFLPCSRWSVFLWLINELECYLGSLVDPHGFLCYRSAYNYPTDLHQLVRTRSPHHAGGRMHNQRYVG